MYFETWDHWEAWQTDLVRRDLVFLDLFRAEFVDDGDERRRIIEKAEEAFPGLPTV
jgi:hypothetical protein